MFKNIKNIIFDLDETLLNENTYRENCLKKIIGYLKLKKNLNYKKSDKKLFNKYKKKIFVKNFITKLANDLGINITKTEIKELFSSSSIQIQNKLVHSLLLNLKRKYKLGLITDGSFVRQYNKLYENNFLKYFDVIIINQNKIKMKPNEYAFKKIIKFLNLLPENCVYIADNPKKDFQGPKKLQMHTIRVKSGKYKTIKSNKYIDREIKNINNLEKIFL